MNEGKENDPKPIEQIQEINTEAVREKLLQVVGTYFPKLPEMIGEMTKDSMQMKMIASSIRPFLPRFETGLIEAIEEADDERIIQLVEFVEGVAEWIKKD